MHCFTLFKLSTCLIDYTWNISEHVFHKPGPDQQEDQRIQHYDEVGGAAAAAAPWCPAPAPHLHTDKHPPHSSGSRLIHTCCSAPSSRSEPSPKTSRQSLSLKQAFLGPKGEGKGHSPHSPKTGDERRSARGKGQLSHTVLSSGPRESCLTQAVCFPPLQTTPAPRGTGPAGRWASRAS